MRKWQVYWKTDWCADTIERICFAPDKEQIIRKYHLTAVDVVWYEIHEIL